MTIDLKSHVDSIVVPHKVWQAGIKKLSLIYKFSTGGKPHIVSLVGESGSGKSAFLNYFRSLHPPTREDDGLYQPIIKVLTPSIPKEKALAGAMLRALKYPLKIERMSEDDRKSKVEALIISCGVKVIMIDEIQHFIEYRNQESVRAAADWLKTLADQTNAILVLSGLPNSLELFYTNEQLARRSFSPITMPRFDWSNSNSRDEYCAVMDAFTEAMKPFSLPDLGSDDMAFRFYCATEGMMGTIVDILRFASWVALENGTQTISLEDLEFSYEQSVLTVGARVNPFSTSFRSGSDVEQPRQSDMVVQEDVMHAQPSRRGKKKAQNELGIL